MLLTTELDKLSGTDWQLFFAQERAKPYFAELDAFVTAAAAEKTVYPAAENIFAAFRACPVSAVRVVILGQDPYHEPGQAMGLSFSVPDGCKAPPSLRNIFKELEAELGPGCAAHTDLTLWARQGVLLLNTVLTVEQGAANAHAGRGWETFTRAALEYAAAHGTAPLAAVLWGKPAQKYAPIFNRAAAHRPVLVLDDPFSALDRSTEDAIFAQLQAYARDQVVFLISHRLYHFPQMQQIIFMEGGRTTVGTHEELMAAVPVYRQLYEGQTGRKGGEGA